MSSFPLNLSALTLGARERLARLDSAGGAVKAFLSPASSVSDVVGASGSAVPPSFGLGAPPPPAAPGGSRLSVEHLLTVGGGRSGEFLVSGGSTGGLSVVVITPDLLDMMCCGAVAGGIKFCTLASADCSFTTHTKKVKVHPNSVYISTGRQSAFSHHYAPVANLSEEQVERLLAERHSKDEWIRLLLGARQGLEVVKPEVPDAAPTVISVLDVVTPGRKRKVRYEDEWDALPMQTPIRGRSVGVSLRESFEGESELVILPSEESADFEVDDKVSAMWAQWSQVIATLQRLGGGLRNLKSLVTEDFAEVDSKMLGIEAGLGQQPEMKDFEDCGTLWDGLVLLNSRMKDMTQELKVLCTDATAKASEVEARGRDSQSQLQLKMEAMITTRFKEVETAMGAIADIIRALNQEQEKVTEAVLNQQAHAASIGGLPAQEVNQMMARLKLLEARLPAPSGGRLGDEAFRSRLDVLTFVEEHVPSNCFYLFHDVVTLMEALTTSHVERKDVLEEWYRSTKVRVNEASARHMASFRLILPTVFGRVKEGSPSSAKHHLPAVRSFKDWNTFDGVSGVKSFIASGMEDLRYQFRQDIDRALDLAAHTKARLLATEMLETSQTFVMEMSSWVDSFFQELVSTSEATEEEAWEVIGACLKKMFEVIRVPRAQAANATMDNDPRSQCTTYLWALIQSHRIMKDFADARFRNHGAIAPVIVLHIFKTRVTRTAMTSNIKRLEARLATLEKGGKDKDKNR